MLLDKYKLSEEDHNRTLLEIKDFVFKNKHSVESPEIYILGGQPGAGKSVLTKRVMQNFKDNNIISINGDEFRLCHPQAQEIFKAHDKMFADYTDADFRTWTSDVFDAAIEGRYNMVFEGTMRTDRICTTIKEKLMKAGYRIHILVVAVPEIKSRISIYSRYQQQLEKYPIARFTSRFSHDAAYVGMIDTLKKIEDEHLYDTITVCNREGDVLFKTGDKDIAAAIQKEREKPLLQKDIRELKAQCDVLLSKMYQRNEETAYIEDLTALRDFVQAQDRHFLENIQQIKKKVSDTKAYQSPKVYSGPVLFPDVYKIR